ncbi:MAG: TVP38/TMEM64 family protein [Haloplanus sp.]
MGDSIFSSDAHRRRFVVHLCVALVLAGLALAWLAPYVDTFRNRHAIQQFVRDVGVAGPIAFVALAVVQIVVMPIPGQVIGLAGGYLFGALRGLVYTLCGIWLGSYVAFRLSRRFGRQYLTTIFAPDAIQRYDATVSKLGIGGLTLLVLLPGLPDDLVCFVCGTSDMTTKQFLTVVVLGRTPAYTLAVLSGAEFGDAQFYRGLTLAALLVVASALGYLERERLERVVLDQFGT